MSIHQYIYVNRSKIDNLYAQLVDRVEEECRKQGKTRYFVQGSISLGGILKWIGGINAGGDLSGEKANSVEVISKLHPENKLMIIQTTLKKFNDCKYLKKDDLFTDSDKGKFISFPANFKVVDVPDIPIKDLNGFNIEGSYSNYYIKIYVGLMEYIPLERFQRMLDISKDGGSFPWRVFGTLVNFIDAKKIAFVDPIAIHYE